MPTRQSPRPSPFSSTTYAPQFLWCLFLLVYYFLHTVYFLTLNGDLAYEILISRGVAMSEFRNPFKTSSLYNEDDEDSDSTVSTSSIPSNAFSGHRDTLALLHFRRRTPTPAIGLPSELLQHVYEHLDPLDFDAARHSCRKWFLASLDRTLLLKMAGRARSVGATNEDFRRRTAEADISDEWLLSKRLNTEARITPGIHLNGTSSAVREEVDFRALLQTTSDEHPGSKHFTTASCGSFLLVSSGLWINVYALCHSLRSVASLQCSRQVLAVSMDTSFGRYSVAVLLAGRRGMCWDMDEYIPEGSLDDRVTIYEQLGTSDDPPRSVAICPQRKCVAFGCRTGLELHWVDSVNGGDLKRWFPLAAPSDHLYFLPQRIDVDSTKRLRLISSARAVPSITVERHSTATTSIVENTDREHQDILRTIECDHFRAVPLSDGVHVLFTDPFSGLLCLGSDAPLGSPTKLIRKFMFLPPGHVSNSTRLLPTCYAAAPDLHWGVRIAAVYGDRSLVLFNIPSDCFSAVKDILGVPDVWNEHAGVIAQSDLLMDLVMDVHTRDDTGSTSRTIQVPGIKVATVENTVDDVAVLCGHGGIRVWVFQSTGKAQCWDIHSRDRPATVRVVNGSGLIVDSSNTDKGKARDISNSTRVHFDVDGSSDNDNTPQQHTCGTMAASPQTF